jgi:ubiquinone/menaquinone biosynthesis C-methylase UbiE
MSEDWRSYDGVAETYERVHAPRFAEVAADLVALAGIAPGMTVLDLGTGTGVVGAAARAAGAGAVGVDPSFPMLRIARAVRPSLPVALAEAIDLPFRPATFDAVLAGFVLAHCARPDTALFDVLRVTKPGGTVGVSAWADGRDAFTAAWLEIVHGAIPKDVLDAALAGAIPHHDRFRKAAGLSEDLHRAGLRTIRVERMAYEWTYAQDDYVDGLQTWATGRFVRGMLDDGSWERLMERTRAVFAERFPDPLHDRRTVLLAVGTNG